MEKFTRTDGFVFSVTFLMFSLGFLGAAYLKYDQFKRYERIGVATTATIIEKRSPCCYIAYRYKAPCDRQLPCIFTEEDDVSYDVFETYQVGDKAEVLYLKNDTEKARLATNRFRYPVELIGIGITFLVGSCVSLLYGWFFNDPRESSPAFPYYPAKKKRLYQQSLPKEHYFRED